MLITTLMFIFSKLFSFILFGQSWSQNLKFFKLTETWYRGRLPYAYLDFNVCFFKFLSFIFSLGKFGPKNQKFSKLNEIWYRGTLDMVISTLTFKSSKFFSFIFFLANLVWKCEVLQFDWNLVHRYITICLFRFYCLVFHFFCHSYFFEQIWSQNLKFVKLTEMSYFDVHFFKILIIHIFGLIWSHKLKIFIPKFGAALHYYMLNMILILIFSKHFVIHIVLGKFRPKAVLPINLNLAFVYIINIISWL